MATALDLVDLEAITASLDEPPQTLDQGRTVAYDVCNPDGRDTWFWFHGSPGCRLEARLAHEWARSRNVRIIALDRPGLGFTDPSPELTALSVAADALAVADAIGLARFSVIGGSGGGPYALACARAFPERLVHVVCTAPGGIAPGARALAGLVDRSADRLSTLAPWLLVAYFRVIALGLRLPRALLRFAAVGVEAPFVRAVVDSGLGSAVIREVFRQGSAGVVDDFRRLGNFGFSLETIEHPVLFVHGRHDPFVPVRQTRGFSHRVPRSRYLELPHAGHGTAIFALDAIMNALP